MTPEDFTQVVSQCTHFLNDHYPRTVRQRLETIIESPHSELRRDAYGKGGFVNVLESEIAELMGKEAAVYMPSGTMAQQIALRIWSDRAQNKSVAFHPLCHLQIHEHMAYQELHHLEAVLLGEPDRLFTSEDLATVNHPLAALLIELPQREIGGSLPTWQELEAITQLAKSKGTKLHLDGARLWECGPYYERSYKEIVADFDSVYVSFYKVLSGLPGAALAGPADFIEEARIWMRRHGGNLHMASPGAVSAKLGLETYLPRIPLYVTKASEVAAILNRFSGVRVVPEQPKTNMMHVRFEASAEKVMDAVGQIAAREKCLLFGWARPENDGSRVELWIGDAGLDIPQERLESLFSELIRSLT